MVNRDRPARPRFFIGAAAAIVAAVEGAFLLARKAQAAVATVVGLSKEVMDLLSAIAQGVGSTLEKLDDILDALPGGPEAAVYPPNADTFVTQFVACPFPQPKAYRLPAFDIPTDMTLQLLARNPIGVNVGIIWVSPTEPGAGQPTQSWPLISNATLGLRVKNASSVYISATVANEGVFISVEQNKG